LPLASAFSIVPSYRPGAVCTSSIGPDFKLGSTVLPRICRKLRNWLFLSSASTTTLIRPCSRRTLSDRLPRSAGRIDHLITCDQNAL